MGRKTSQQKTGVDGGKVVRWSRIKAQAHRATCAEILEDITRQLNIARGMSQVDEPMYAELQSIIRAISADIEDMNRQASLG